MRATLAGLGAQAALEGQEAGFVLASFRRACYVAFPAGLVALVAPDVLPGPLHLVLDRLPPAPARGARVSVAGGAIGAAGWSVRTREVSLWTGVLPDPQDLRAGSRTALAAGRRVAAGSALTTGPFRERANRARASLLAGDLDDAAALLVGLGPGLTPAGDDALCGILLVLRCVLGEGFEPRAMGIAGGAQTTEPSRAFLAWAARGQALAPAHDLLIAAARGDEVAATTAFETLGRVGETSGSDFVLGLGWGFEAVTAGAASYREAMTSR